jgi:outer membrane protein OmpA-like peptidoglycan-associated protein
VWPFGAKAEKASTQTVAAPSVPLPAPSESSTAIAVSDTTAQAPESSATSSPAVPPPASDAASTTTADANPPLNAIPDVREFTVYFPFNSSRLNAAAQSVVVEAAGYAKQAPSPKVAVTGYTDTSGSAAYNMILSKRRANAVASGLKAEGVPGEAITISGKGESDLAVPTRNGVAKSANRRTVIEVSF